MRLGIIGGAGTLGSTMGFYFACHGWFEEVVLLDLKENMVRWHVMDIEQAISDLNATKVSYGTWKDLDRCDVILMTAGLPHANVSSRNEFLKGNAKIIESVAQNIRQYCEDAVIINATVPVDVFNYAFYKLIGFDRRRFLGFNRNDSLRLRWAAAKVLGLNQLTMGGYVLGEHGETQVPVYGTLTSNDKKIDLSSSQKADIGAVVKNWFAESQSLNTGRTSGWTSTTSMAKVVEAMVKESPVPITCSIVLEGEYGLSDVSVGLPVLLGPKGWKEVVHLELTPEEEAALQHSAKTIRKLIDDSQLIKNSSLT